MNRDTHELGVCFATASKSAMPHRIKVAFVAPSLRILGGQAVQADRLLSRGETIPTSTRGSCRSIPAARPAPLRANSIKYLRTVVNELTYLPLLVRELARADVVHVFSASYTLVPAGAAAGDADRARLLGKPVVLNYRSGEAPDHLRRSAIARRTIRDVST